MEEIRYVCPKCGYEFKGNFNGLNANLVCLGCKSDKDKFMRIKEVEDDSGAKVIAAHYDSLKEWKMDPKGFFTIKPFPEEGLIKVRYYKKMGKAEALIIGRNAEEIYNTIVREGFISSLSHSANIGMELMNAEICLKLNLEYVQDDNFPINKVRKI